MQSDATALADAIGAGKISASEAMQASLGKATEFSSLGAITRCEPDMGARTAADFDLAIKEHPDRNTAPFGGVPSLVKDLGGPFAGFPIHAGSKAMRHVDGNADSELAEKFRQSGVCIFGVTTSPEFGLSLASEPAIGPMCRNPLNTELTPGGSSGGAASAVAAGIVSIAHATDAGGSIRVPAACCGLVGLKPSRGAIPGGPTFGNHIGGLASELAVCRSVRDTSAIFDAIAGNSNGPYPPMERERKQPQNFRIGMITSTGAKYPTDPERIVAVEEAGRALAASGHNIVDAAWSDIAQLVDDSAEAFASCISVNLAEFAASSGLDFGAAEQITQAALARGQTMRGTEIWNAQNKMVLVSHGLWQLFENFDCLLTPMLSTAPKPIGAFPTDHNDISLHFERMSEFAPLATLANVSGFPAITLPFGTDANELPLPIQLIAPMGMENRLLTLAADLESEERWQHRYPIAGLIS